MSDRDILEALSEIARRELDVERPLAPEERLVEDLALDSLKLLSLAVAVENHFEIYLEEEDEEELSTVGQLVQLIRRKQAANDDR